MTNQRPVNVPDTPPELFDIPEPAALLSPTVNFTGKPLTPVQIVHFYSPNEWEEFVTEWVYAIGDKYKQVKRLGGPGDHGVDVAAFNTQKGLEGSWDCFQAKHYKDVLTFSDAFPEILKIFHGAVAGYYCLPDRYVFVSPNGCGQRLNTLLSTPTSLKEKFLEKFNERTDSTGGFDEETLRSIGALAQSTDFSMFQSLELHEMIEACSGTKYFAARFGTPLPQRDLANKLIPETPKADETVYVRKLLDIYQELDSVSCADIDSVSTHPKYSSHFQRQRVDFYSAEALRLYARDSVPDGTYELLQNDVYAGVIDTAEAEYKSGMERLRAVLSQSGRLDLQAHTLISRATLNDRKGICHQLANADKLTWVETNE